MLPVAAWKNAEEQRCVAARNNLGAHGRVAGVSSLGNAAARGVHLGQCNWDKLRGRQEYL